MPHLVLIRSITPEKANMAINRTISLKENDIPLLSISAIKHILDSSELIHFATGIAGIPIPSPSVNVAATARTTSPWRMGVIPTYRRDISTDSRVSMSNKARAIHTSKTIPSWASVGVKTGIV